MNYPYDASYRPPFPVTQVVFHNSDEELSAVAEKALLDTGSDGTLVPIEYLYEILAPAVRDTRIRSHWGEWRPVQLFLVDLELGEMMLHDVTVVGDGQGEEIILGRNVLNRLRIILDGPARHTEIYQQEPL